MMKKGFMYQAMAILSGLVLAGAVFAAEMDHSGHDMAGGKKMEKPFHQSVVDGYNLTYKLIDMKAKMKDMAGMDHVTATHHLMVYVSMKHGDHVMPVTNAKVGYLVEGADGTKETAMCMAMSGGFGADLNLSKKGMYTIKAKIMDGDKKIMDEFHHTVQ